MILLQSLLKIFLKSNMLYKLRSRVQYILECNLKENSIKIFKKIQVTIQVNESDNDDLDYSTLNWNLDTVKEMRESLLQRYKYQGRALALNESNNANNISLSSYLRDIDNVPVIFNLKSPKQCTTS